MLVLALVANFNLGNSAANLDGIKVPCIMDRHTKTRYNVYQASRFTQKGGLVETTIKEIAALLRSTEQMAAQFVNRVETRVGQPVSHAEILSAMQKISSKSLSMEKVIAKIQQRRKSTNQRTTRRSSTYPAARSRSSLHTASKMPSPMTPWPEPKTILEQLAFVLQDNWERAEAEGLQPSRMSVEAFVNAIYQHTDRREGTRRRILQAAKQLDEDDVLLTPALVADIVHELSES